MGNGASTQIPMHVDLETFRRLSGSTFNDPIFHQFAVDGVMSRDKLLELSQTTDCYLSFDERDEAAAAHVGAINGFLQSRGLITYCPSSSSSSQLRSLCSHIDKTRSFVFFMTRGYVERITTTAAGSVMDRCFTEFNYALRRKFSDKMIPVVLDDVFSGGGDWPGIFSQYFGPSGSVQADHYSNVEALFQRVAKVTRERAFGQTQRAKHSYDAKLEVRIPGVPPLATREEAQFYLWMTRAAPGIDDLTRTMYCGALTHLCVTTVQKLAERMKDTQNFLILHAGFMEHDADEIALAISDLGLGYNPVRDFSTSETIESAVYAMKKACVADCDPELAANALNCLARVVSLDTETLPKMCAAAGLCDPTVKLLQRYLGDPTVVENACAAINSMAQDVEVAERLGVCGVCDVVPRAMQSHLVNARTILAGMKVITILSRVDGNKLRFGTAGACDVVMRGLLRHVSLEEVAYWGCSAAFTLGSGCGENIGRLAYSQGCENITRALAAHSSSAAVSGMALRCMILMAVDAEYRERMGTSGACEATIATLRSHLGLGLSGSSEALFIVENGLVLQNALIVGNSNNRAMFGRSGACIIVQQAVELYGGASFFPTVVQHACTAIYSLASGSPDNQKALLQAGLHGYLQALLKSLKTGGMLAGADPEAIERLRAEAQEAHIRLTRS